MRNPTTVLSVIRLRTWGNVLQAAFIWLLCMTACYAQNWPVSVVAPRFSSSSAGFPAYIALDAVGNVYAADSASRSIHEYTPTGIGYIPQKDIAQLDPYAYPGGMVIDDAGNVYVCDQYAIHKFGPGPLYQKNEDVASSLTGAKGLAVDTIGNVYVIAFTGPNKSAVLKFAPSANGYVRQADVVSDTSQFVSLAVDRDDTVFVGIDGGTVRKYSLHGTNYVRDIDVVVSNTTPIGLAIDDTGAIYLAESTSASGAVRKFQPSGASYIEAPHVDDFAIPLSDVKVDRLGNVYVVDGISLAIRKYVPAGSTYARQADVVHKVGQILATATDRNGNVYVANGRNVYKYSNTGVGYAVQGEVASSALGSPAGVAVDSNGNVYVTDSLLHAVHKYSASTSGYIKQADVANSGLSAPTGIAVDGLGNVYVVDTGYYPDVSVVRVYRPDGTGYSKLADIPGSNFIGSFQGIAVDAGGNIYVADVYSVHKYALTTFGYTPLPDLAGNVRDASGIAVDSAGNVYVADEWAIHQYVLSNGTYSERTPPYSFANGVVPQGISADEHSNVFFTDGTNQLLSAAGNKTTTVTLTATPTLTPTILYGLPYTEQWAASSSDGVSHAPYTFTVSSGSLPSGLTLTTGGLLSGMPSAFGSFSFTVQAVGSGGVYGLQTYTLVVTELYDALIPARLLDTRTGSPTVDGIAQGIGPIASTTIYRLPVTGRAGIPTGVVAVALNVTPVNPRKPGYLTLWSGVGGAPVASNLNYNPGYTIPNLVISPVDSSGNVALYNGSVAAQDVVVDVQGYFPAGSAYMPMTPQRYLDTRSGSTTADGQDQGHGAIVPGGHLDLGIAGRTSIPLTGVDAVIFNLTAVSPTGPGYITAWPMGQSQPLASNLNLNNGLTIPNLVVAGLGSGEVSLLNGGTQATDLVADVQGWFPSGSGYTALTPARLLDTRARQATIDGQDAGIGALASSSTLQLAVAGRGNVPINGAGAVVLNVTAVQPTAPGYITVWPTGSARPLASNLNLNPGTTIPNLVIAKIGNDGTVSIFNGSQNSTDILVDVQGWLPGTY